MPDLPIMLRVAERRVVIVGGGAVALRRCRALLACGARVAVVAPQIDPGIVALKDSTPALTTTQRRFEEADVDGALLVIAATDDPAVNADVADAARRAGVLVNRVDEPAAGDVTLPAHGRTGPITVAVDTAATAPATAARLRDELLAQIAPDLPALLDAVAPWRAILKNTVPDPAVRAQRLRHMTDDDALHILQRYGPDALNRHLAAIAAGHPTDHTTNNNNTHNPQAEG